MSNGVWPLGLRCRSSGERRRSTEGQGPPVGNREPRIADHNAGRNAFSDFEPGGKNGGKKLDGVSRARQANMIAVLGPDRVEVGTGRSRAVRDVAHVVRRDLPHVVVRDDAEKALQHHRQCQQTKKSPTKAVAPHHAGSILRTIRGCVKAFDIRLAV